MAKNTVEGRDWEQFYQETPADEHPWNYPDLDPDLQAFLADHHPRTVLDIGAGSGYQTMALAGLGLQVSSLDLSATAMERLRRQVASAAYDVTCHVGSILDFTTQVPFDLLVDRGCFHCLQPEDRGSYAHQVQTLLAPRGTLFLKCFSDREPDTEEGPYRISRAILETSFAGSLQIASIQDTILPLNRRCLHREPPLAYCVLLSH